MNIELLQGTLEVGENPGLETVDPRFTDIAELVQGGRYEDAAARAEEVLAEKIYDIRVIGYFLYGHFLEQGPPALADIYLCLTDLLRDNMDALGPVKNRVKHIQTILNWLTKQILKKLQYEEESKSGLYNRWISGVSSDQVQEVLDAGNAMRRTLGPVLEDAAGPVLDGITKINNWFQSFQRLIYREAEAEPAAEDEKESTNTGKETESDEEIEQEPRQTGGKRFYQPTVDAEDEMAGREGSYLLKILIKKLDAFDHLVSAQKYASAAIVADDINAIVANFDPKIYFPKLFVRFALQFATHINHLTAFSEYKDSPAWQALQELYKVDLESFVDFDPESIELGASGSSGSYGASDDYDRMPEEEEG